MSQDQVLRDNYGLLAVCVRKYARLVKHRAALDVDDLWQVGAMALLDAHAKYDPERGSWSHYAYSMIKYAILDALGYSSGTPEPIALSLDAPAYDGDDCDVLLGETIPDESAVDALGDILDSEVVQAVRAAVDSLPEPLQEVTRRHDLDGQMFTTCAAVMGLKTREVQRMHGKALQALRKDRRIRALADLELETRYHARKGVRAFNSSGSSIVEDLVEWRMRAESRHIRDNEKQPR